MFQYEDEQLPVKIKGKEYSLRAPSAKEQDDISKMFTDAKGKEGVSAVEIYANFFETIGLPKEVSMSMTLKGMVDLFSYVVGAKKN